MRLTQIIKLPGGIKIQCDRLNWVLEDGDKNNRCYFVSLDELCDELLELRIKEETKKTRKGLESLREAVWNARVAVREDMERLQTIMTNADRARKKRNFT